MKSTRKTKQKEIILNILRQKDIHLTAEQIYKSAKKKIMNISLATIYRNLESMVESGMLYEVYVAGFPKWYEIKKYSCHGHLFCNSCNKLIDVVDCGLCFFTNRVKEKMDFEEEEVFFLVKGRCGKCH